MKNLGCMTLTIAALLAVPAHAQTTFVVQATADRVNLRSRPWPTAEVLLQAAEGEQLQGQTEQGEWIGVTAPTGVTLFAKAEMIKDSVVVKGPLSLRAGPGVSYSRVTIIPARTRLTVAGTAGTGDWLRVAAPAGTLLWVNRQFTTRPGAAASASIVSPRATIVNDAPAPADNAGNAGPVIVSSNGMMALTLRDAAATQPTPFVPAPPELARRGLSAALGQGRLVTVEGVLREVHSWFGRVARYKLVSDDTDQAVIVAYLYADAGVLSAQTGTRMNIRGREYWVEKTDVPVIVPETLEVPKKQE
ncbi:MAG: SH3 domain-containing protein [bacterium]